MKIGGPDVNANCYTNSCASCGWVNFSDKMCMWHRTEKNPIGVQCNQHTSHMDLINNINIPHIIEFIRVQTNYYGDMYLPPNWNVSDKES